MDLQIGQEIAWETKEYGYVLGTIFEIRAASVLVSAKSCERNCRGFDRKGSGPWHVTMESVRELQQN